jgi:hypothetical protein
VGTCLKIKDENYKFNSFLYIFLNIFEASLPIQDKSVGRTENDWITEGLKISSKCIRHLSVYPHRRPYSIKCCEILRRVIKEAKR